MPLLQWDLFTFDVHPVNFNEMDHNTATEYARKGVAGAMPPREWTGEDDEELHLRGKIFPFRIGGFNEIEVLNNMRSAGHAGLMVRGGVDGTELGWFVCERLSRLHRYIAPAGVGQEIQFEGLWVRVPAPQLAGWVHTIYSFIP